MSTADQDPRRTIRKLNLIGLTQAKLMDSVCTRPGSGTIKLRVSESRSTSLSLRLPR
jgi:hypothetical protein